MRRQRRSGVVTYLYSDQCQFGSRWSCTSQLALFTRFFIENELTGALANRSRYCTSANSI